MANMHTCRCICTSTSLRHKHVCTHVHSPMATRVCYSSAHLWQTLIPADTNIQGHSLLPHEFSHPFSLDPPSVRVSLPILFPHHEAEGEWTRAEFHFNHLWQEANASGDNDATLKCCSTAEWGGVLGVAGRESWYVDPVPSPTTQSFHA